MTWTLVWGALAASQPVQSQSRLERIAGDAEPAAGLAEIAAGLLHGRRAEPAVVLFARRKRTECVNPAPARRQPLGSSWLPASPVTAVPSGSACPPASVVITAPFGSKRLPALCPAAQRVDSSASARRTVRSMEEILSGVRDVFWSSIDQMSERENPRASLPLARVGDKHDRKERFHGQPLHPDPGDGTPVAAAPVRGRRRRLCRAPCGPRGDAPPGGHVGPRPLLVPSGVLSGALATPGRRHVGGGAQGDRRVRRSRRLFRAGRLAGLRARRPAGPALVAAGLRQRGRTGRPGPGLHRLEEGPRHQPRPPGEPCVRPPRRADRREPAGPHRAPREGDAVLWVGFAGLKAGSASPGASQKTSTFHFPRAIVSLPRTIGSLPRAIVSSPRAIGSLPRAIGSLPWGIANPERGRLNPERGGLNPERGRLNPERGGLNPERGRSKPERGGLNPERGIFALQSRKSSGGRRRAHPTRKIFITSSPRWLMTFTAIRPEVGLAKGREVSLWSVAQASSSISALRVVLSAL